MTAKKIDNGAPRFNIKPLTVGKCYWRIRYSNWSEDGKTWLNEKREVRVPYFISSITKHGDLENPYAISYFGISLPLPHSTVCDSGIYLWHYSCRLNAGYNGFINEDMVEMTYDEAINFASQLNNKLTSNSIFQRYNNGFEEISEH